MRSVEQRVFSGLNRVPHASAGVKGGGWQVTLCYPVWHYEFPVVMRLSCCVANYYTLFTLLYFIRCFLL